MKMSSDAVIDWALLAGIVLAIVMATSAHS
jgi:hypothetical protein